MSGNRSHQITLLELLDNLEHDSDTNSDRRGAERFGLAGQVEYLLNGKFEGKGSILNISESGLAIVVKTSLAEVDESMSIGDEIVLYAGGLGRLAGRVVRQFAGGIGVHFSSSENQRLTLRKKLNAARSGKPFLRLLEDRSGMRIRYNISTSALCGDSERHINCKIVDMSLSGCLLECDERPAIGEKIRIGILLGNVARHTTSGIAVAFASENFKKSGLN